MRKNMIVILLILSIFSCSRSDVPFIEYIAKYPEIKLPYYFGFDSLNILKNTKKTQIPDTLVEAFISRKTTPFGVEIFRHYYYGCIVKSDTIIAVIYKKKGGAGGYEANFELAVYEPRGGKLIDRVVLCRITSDLGRLFMIQCKIDSDLTVTQESIEYERVEDQELKLVKKKFLSKIKITTKGVQLLEGEKQKVVDW